MFVADLDALRQLSLERLWQGLSENSKKLTEHDTSKYTPLTSAHIFGLFSVTRRSRSDVCQSVSVSNFTDVTLVSDDTDDLDDPE